MLKIIGNEVWRGGEKAGYIEGHHVYTHDGRKLGYFTDHHVWSEDDEKVAYVEGDDLFSESGGTKIPLEHLAEKIEGGVMPIIAKCAIYVLLGD